MIEVIKQSQKKFILISSRKTNYVREKQIN